MGGNRTTWFISGCSTGFGRSLTQAVLLAGHQVAVTARDRDRIADLAALAPDRAIGLELDVTSPAQIMAAVAQVEERFGRIDILVNNAGYAYQSSVEEGEEARIRAMFEANLFGLFALTRAILPIMRRQRRGHIISISSVVGLLGLAGSGYYAATKHAVEGWSDALRAEVAPLGIQVSCVEPGPFRTDFASRSLERTECAIEDYAQTVARRIQAVGAADDDRPGDPDRAARAIIAMALAPDAPRHLVLGGTGHAMVMKRLAERIEEIGGLGDIARSADFPKH